jgi:hypothetical protein
MYDCAILMTDCNLHLFDKIMMSIFLIIALIQIIKWIIKLWNWKQNH